MSDAEMRALARAVQLGDVTAAARLRRQMARAGAPFVMANLVEPEVPVWLVDQLVLIGEITLLVGLMGAGKSPLAAAIVAAITRGAALPWPSPNPRQGNVLWVGEERPGIVRARLGRLGADVSRLAIQEDYAFDDAQIAGAIDTLRARLVVIDPATLIFPPSRSPRVALGATREAARRNETALLILMHAGKCGRHHSAIQAALGTSDSAAVARSILFLWRDPEDERRLILAQARNCYGDRVDSMEFELQGAAILWRGTVDISADELVSVAPAAIRRRTRAPRVIDRALEIISAALTEAPHSAGDLITQCLRAGISERTAREAASRLEVVSEATRDLGRITGWTWSLPAAGSAAGGDEPEEAVVPRVVTDDPAAAEPAADSTSAGPLSTGLPMGEVPPENIPPGTTGPSTVH